uniref:K Homology domain-containing protein n=1 Tax=Timema bartmani TaxID=61472 RepID=A0A7R9I6X1_9NEOP|nr:unnamed protein product [Timema bartmani]
MNLNKAIVPIMLGLTLSGVSAALVYLIFRKLKLEPHRFLNVYKGVVACYDLNCVGIEEICEEFFMLRLRCRATSQSSPPISPRNRPRDPSLSPPQKHSRVLLGEHPRLLGEHSRALLGSRHRQFHSNFLNNVVCILYKLCRNLLCIIANDEDLDEKYLAIKTSRPALIEVQIPRDCVGVIIGRGGSNIKSIQDQTNTKIHFKDELETDEFRVCVIRGTADSAQVAEFMIRDLILNQPLIETVEIKIPQVPT